MSENDQGSCGGRESNSLRPLLIETSRLSMRELAEPDLRAFHAIANQRSVADMLASIPHPFSLDDARNWLAARRYVGAPGFVAGVFLEDGELIGCIGLSDYPRTVNYFVNPKHWGRGYATEILAPFLDWCAEAFALDEYWVGVVDSNIGSRKVLEKVGFDLMYASRFQSDVRQSPDRLLIFWKGYGAEKPLVQHTQRLYLSPLHLAHAKRLSELTDVAELAGIVADIQQPFTPELAKQWIRMTQEHENMVPMAIVLKEGRLVGAGYMELAGNTGSITIWIGQEHRRSGLGTEALGGLIDLAFDRFSELDVLEYVVGPDNPAAIRLLERMNFSHFDKTDQQTGSSDQAGDAIVYRLERGR